MKNSEGTFTTQNNKSIILFDGVCNYCNSIVNFIIRHDSKDHFLFCPTQAKQGQQLIKSHRIDFDVNQTVVLLEGNNIYVKSTAVLRIFRRLNGWIPFLYVFILVPRVLRDFVYDFIAKHRYHWFGKRDVCMVPDEKVKSKFLW